MVTITGLHGSLPGTIRLDTLAIADAKGPWLTARSVALDWSPLHLLARDAAIQSLSVASLAVARLPVSTAPAQPNPKPFHLPVHIDVDTLAIADLSLAAPLAGAPAHLAITAAAHLRTLTNGTLTAALRRTDQPGSYALAATLTDQTTQAHLSVQEPAQGLIATAAHLPDLGAIGLDATLAGPNTAAVLRLALAAGQLRSTASGTLNLDARSASLALTADAPAMAVAPGIAWQALAVAAHLDGPFARPAANGTVHLAGLRAGGNAIGAIDGHITADTHTAALTATVANITLAPPNQTLLAGGPLTLAASLNLDDPAHPATYRFQQALLQGQGTAILAPDLRANLAVTLPSLAVLSRAKGRDVQGDAGFTLAVSRLKAATTIALDAALAVTGGADAPPAARGRTTLGATVTLHGPDITLSRLVLDGTTLHADATGSRINTHVTAAVHVISRDLHDLTPGLRGVLDLTGHIDGTQQDFAADAAITGTLGTASFAPAPLTLTLHGAGLPDVPAGHLHGSATLAGAPLTLDIDATRSEPGAGQGPQPLHVTINRADWKSAVIAGALTLPPGAKFPNGALTITMPRLADLAQLLGRPVGGSLAANLSLPATGAAALHLTAANAGVPGTSISRLLLDAKLDDPADRRILAATLAATGLHSGQIAGDLRLAANGPPDALALRLTAALRNLAGADAAITAAATLDTKAKALHLATLAADWHAEAFRLAAPATLTYAPAIAIDRLRLTATTPGAPIATLDLAGRISPTLALTVTAQNVTPALAKPFAPTLDAAGTIHLDAQLAGTPAAPTGAVHLTATGLRLRHGPASALPPAAITADATLAGVAARLTARIDAGPTTHLAATGTVPLSSTGPLALRADGALSLALLDPILTAQGRRLRGDATLDATIAGTPTAPAVTGTLHLANGEFQDYAQGIHVTDIAALIEATGHTIAITRFTGRAGGGTLAVSGTVGLTAPMPIDLHLTADNARPITSDLVTATLDADIALTGTAQDTVTAKGRIHIRRADIQVPDRLPTSVAVLDVRRPGDRPPPRPAGPGLQIPLAITLDAPRQIFVRGHGLDAELGGTLQIAGTAAAPRTAGSIDLRRGTFSLAGQTLTFTSGDISFNGATKIDPALNLMATSSNAEIVATLTVGGYASAPKITLSSVPDRPQDEILAALLFNQTSASLSPFQLAQIAAALAQVSGVGGGGPDPISRLRKGLGLDRLSVGTTGTGSTATTAVEAGRYVAPGIYVGAKQGTSAAGGTQAEVQIDITRGLKLNSDVGNGPGGNNIGLTYQFQY